MDFTRNKTSNHENNTALNLDNQAWDRMLFQPHTERSVCMTANQVAYGRLVEDRRKNRTEQAETSRHNRASEGIQSAQVGVLSSQLAETIRHNQVGEEQNWQNLLQQGASLQNKAISDRIQATAARSNADSRAAEVGIRQGQLDVQQGQAEETVRHNLETEDQGRKRLALDTTTGLARAIADTVGALRSRSIRFYPGGN